MLEVNFGSAISDSVRLADAPLDRSGSSAAVHFFNGRWEFNLFKGDRSRHRGILYLELRHLLSKHGHLLSEGHALLLCYRLGNTSNRNFFSRDVLALLDLGLFGFIRRINYCDTVFILFACSISTETDAFETIP